MRPARPAPPLATEESMLEEIVNPIANLRKEILDIWGRL